MLAKKLKSNLPRVVIFGRANVGKSTLFNTLTERKQALIADIAGTTRDANFGDMNWRGTDFELVDTGGFLDLKFLASKKANPDSIDERVQVQARQLVTRADLILFLVDNNDGLMEQDKQMAKIIKKIITDPKKIILIANKVDNAKRTNDASVFYQLGLGEVHTISAVSGAGTGDLLDILIARLKEQQPETKVKKIKERKIENTTETREEAAAAAENTEDDTIKIAIIGKPNVGKSSLMNSLLGYERVIVSPIAHTTREPQNTKLTFNGRNFVLIDTAGINKHWDHTDRLTKMGIAKSLAIINEADIVFLVLDVSDELTKQEAKLTEEIITLHKSLIIVANKWDLVPDRDPKIHTRRIYQTLPFVQFAPVHFMSAKNRTKLDSLMNLAIKIADNRKLQVTYSQLLKFIKGCINKHKPTKGKGTRFPHIYNFFQTKYNQLEFAIQVGSKEYLADSYLHYVANQLRLRYDLEGTPINIWVDKRRVSAKLDNDDPVDIDEEESENEK